MTGNQNYISENIRLINKQIEVLEGIVERIKLLDMGLSELLDMINTFAENCCEGCALVQDYKLVWVNRAAITMSGYESDEIIGKDIADFVVPALRDKMLARIKMTLAGDRLTFPQEWQILRADRTKLYVNVFAYRVKYMGKSAVLVFFYDMSDQKKMIDDLKMRAEMLDAVSDCVFLMEMSGKIVYVNEALCELCQYTRDELLKMHILDITAPELRKRFDIRMRQYSVHKEARYTSAALRRDGVRIPVEVRGRIIKSGARERLLAIARPLRTDAEPDIESVRFDKNNKIRP